MPICAADGCGADFTPHPKKPSQRFCCDSCRKRTWHKQKYHSDEEYREDRLARNRAYYDSLTGLEYARRRLQMRRVKALLRQSARHARREASTKEG